MPLGHPGESLGLTDTAYPLSPPTHWRLAEDHLARHFCGTSLHAPATAENIAAIRALAELGFREVLLDDDCRLARSPGEIGGCFCAEHRAASGLDGADWERLRADVAARRATPLVRAWLERQQAEMSGFLAALDAADARVRVGLCVMELGDEKAGVPLAALSSRRV